MKEIRIFLASSYELEPDRIRFGDLIRGLNDEYESQGIHLRLIKWEDLPGFYTRRGQQAEYDDYVAQSHIFVALFWNYIGKYTQHELEVAHEKKVAHPIWLRSTSNTALTPFERQAVEKFLRNCPEIAGASNRDGKNTTDFVGQEKYKNEYQGEYQSFDDLAKQFTEYLAAWILKNRTCLTDRRDDNAAKQRSSIITFAEGGLEFDHACIRDLIRSLDEHGWNNRRYRVSDAIPDNDNDPRPLMVCLNLSKIPSAEAELIEHFLEHSDENTLISPLLMMQHESENQSELEKWYRDCSQYSVSYESLDSMRLKFIQNLLIHWEGENHSHNGMLMLKDSCGNDFPLLDLSGIKAVREEVENLRCAEKKVEDLNAQRRQNLFDNEIAGALTKARTERAQCVSALDMKIEAYLARERYLLLKRSQTAQAEFDELIKLSDEGKNEEYNAKLAEILSKTDDPAVLSGKIAKLAQQLDETEEQQYRIEREKAAADFVRSRTSDELEAAKQTARVARCTYCNAALNALFNERPLEAIEWYQKADRLYDFEPEEGGRIRDVWLPLCELYFARRRFADAAGLYEKCINLLRKLPQRPWNAFLNLCFRCAECCLACTIKLLGGKQSLMPRNFLIRGGKLIVPMHIMSKVKYN